MSIDTNELARLRAVAEAATDAAWGCDDIYGLVAPSQIDGYVWPRERDEAQQQITADRAHIAAFDPPTALALLDEVGQAKREVVESIATAIEARAAQVYPPDLFIPPTSDQYAEINALLKHEFGHMLDGIAGDIMRRAHAGIVHEIRNDFEGFMARAATPPAADNLTTEKDTP